jgi:nucleoside-diphosphate-sugar epimerase
MADNGSILVTGAAGQLGAVGRNVTGLLLDRGLPVRAMVRREDDRAAALRAAGAEVVVGDLLEPAETMLLESPAGARPNAGAFAPPVGCHAREPRRSHG